MIDGGPVGGQVWTAAGSPYLVRGMNGNLTVAAGEELRIEAGATVLFYGRLWTRLADGRREADHQRHGRGAGDAARGDGRVRRGWDISHRERGRGHPDHGRRDPQRDHGVNITRLADVQIGRTTFDSAHGRSSSTKDRSRSIRSIARNNHHGVSAGNGGSVTLANAPFQGNLNEGLMVIVARRPRSTALQPELRRRLGDPRRGRRARPPVQIQNAIVSNNTHAAFQDYAGRPRIPASAFRARPSGATRRTLSSRRPPVDGTTAPPGTEVAVADPKFVSATDLHLERGQPVHRLRRGGGRAGPRPGWNPRPQGAAVDRGAYEFMPAPAARAAAGGGGGAGGAGGGGVGGGGNAGRRRWRKRGPVVRGAAAASAASAVAGEGAGGRRELRDRAAPPRDQAAPRPEQAARPREQAARPRAAAVRPVARGGRASVVRLVVTCRSATPPRTMVVTATPTGVSAGRGRARAGVLAIAIASRRSARRPTIAEESRSRTRMRGYHRRW